MEQNMVKFNYYDGLPYADQLEKLDGLAEYLSKWYANDVPGMEQDDILQELRCEMLKGAQSYAAKPVNEFVILIKTMLYYRIGELRYFYYSTFRKAYNVALNLDDLEEVLRLEDSPELWIESKQKVQTILSKLSGLALEIATVLLCDDSELTDVIRNKKTTINAIKRTHIEEAVQARPAEFNQAWKLIKTTCMEAFA